MHLDESHVVFVIVWNDGETARDDEMDQKEGKVLVLRPFFSDGMCNMDVVISGK